MSPLLPPRSPIGNFWVSFSKESNKPISATEEKIKDVKKNNPLFNNSATDDEASNTHLKDGIPGKYLLDLLTITNPKVSTRTTRSQSEKTRLKIENLEIKYIKEYGIKKNQYSSDPFLKILRNLRMSHICSAKLNDKKHLSLRPYIELD